MLNHQCITVHGRLKEQTVCLCSGGKSEQDVAEAIGELEHSKVRYMVLPTEAHLKAYRAMVKASAPNAEQTMPNPLKSLQEADQVCQLAQIEVDRILSNLMDLVQAKVKASKSVKRELETFCEEAKGVMASAMNDINFIAGEHGAHYSSQ